MATELTKTGITALGEMPWGTHFCYFYETKQDLLDTLIPYFKEGLNNHEYCLWVISDPLKEKEARNELRRAVPEADRHLAAGDIEIVPHQEWYFRGGFFDQEQVIESWKEKTTQALAKGYVGLRGTGNVWPTEDNLKHFGAYEKEIDHSLGAQRIIVVCTYPLAVSGAGEILDVVQTHQFAIAKRYGKLEVVETQELKQVQEELIRLNGELERRVVERTLELAAANEALTRQMAERRKAEERLREYEKVVEGLEEMIVVVDRDYRYLLANRAFLKYRGMEKKQVVGRVVPEVLDPDVFYKEAKPRIDACWEGSVVKYEHKFTYPNLGERDLSVSYLPIEGPNGIDRVACVLQDITDRKKAEAELQATTKQLRALSAGLQSAREQEGTRIAREIHDELGSALTSLRWDLEGLEQMFTEKADQAQLPGVAEKLAKMIKLTDATVSTVRRIASELRPSVLDDLGLVTAIEWQAQQFQVRAGIICHCDCLLENVNLNEEQTTAVFRVFQEALTNILRHSGATQVNVSAKERAGDFELTIKDNGRGIRKDERAGMSLGILGMRERIHLVGGEFDISGVRGKGTVITVRVPNPVR